MNHHIQSGGMTALLAALLTAQWFSSSTEGFLDACGNAVWLPVLVGGLALAGLTALLQRLAPEEGLLNLGRPAALCVALLMTLVGATALRDTLTMLATFLLQQSPRWYTLLLLLPVLILTGCLGMCSVARPLRLIAPALAIGYAAVLLLSVWSQADVYHFFPLLDTGLPKLAGTAVRRWRRACGCRCCGSTSPGWAEPPARGQCCWRRCWPRAAMRHMRCSSRMGWWWITPSLCTD